MHRLLEPSRRNAEIAVALARRAVRPIAGLAKRWQMEEALLSRNIAIYRPTVEDFEHDMDTIRQVLGPIRHVDHRE